MCDWFTGSQTNMVHLVQWIFINFLKKKTDAPQDTIMHEKCINNQNFWLVKSKNIERFFKPFYILGMTFIVNWQTPKLFTFLLKHEFNSYHF